MSICNDFHTNTDTNTRIQRQIQIRSKIEMSKNQVKSRKALTLELIRYSTMTTILYNTEQYCTILNNTERYSTMSTIPPT